MNILRGLTINGVFSVLIVLYIAYLFHTSLKLGLPVSVFNAIAISVNLIFGKFCKYNFFKTITKAATFAAFAGCLYFVISTSKESFIVYNICYACAIQLLLLTINVNVFVGAELSFIKNDYTVEYFSANDITLNIGRMLGFFGMFVIGYLILYFVFGIYARRVRRNKLVCFSPQ